MTLPGVGIAVTVQRSTEDRHGDRTYTDHHIIRGCKVAPRTSTENTDRRDQVVVGKTIYAPPGADVMATDRLLLHPFGMAEIPDDAVDLRAAVAYQVEGDPGDWSEEATGMPSLVRGWHPGLEIPVRRVDG